MVLQGCKTCHCCQYLRAEWMVANLWQSRCGSRRCCHSNLWRQARHHLQCLRGELQLGRRPSLCLPNHVGFHFHAQHHNIQIRHSAGRNDVSPDFAQQTNRCQELHNGEVGSQWSDGANCHAWHSAPVVLEMALLGCAAGCKTTCVSSTPNTIPATEMHSNTTGRGRICIGTQSSMAMLRSQ